MVSLEISEKDLSEIIQPRLHEMFNLAKEEINKSDHKSEFTFGIILTGGGASLKNIADAAQDIFNMPVKIGIPDSVNGKILVVNVFLADNQITEMKSFYNKYFQNDG